MNRDYLEHIGVMGMRWGHHKIEEPDKSIILKKGSLVQHVSENANLKPHSGGMYVSYTKKDLKQYQTEFADYIRGVRSVDKVFSYNFKTTKDLIVPSKKERIKALVELHRKDTAGDIVKEMGENKITLSFFLAVARALGHNTADKNAQNYRKLLNSDNPRDQEKAFKDFSMFLVISDKNRKKYLERLGKKGFNSMLDDFDKGQGYSESPLIVFDPTKTLQIESKTEVK